MYRSQCGQDRYVSKTLFPSLAEGFYVDVGANDGETHSNTYHFEKRRGWNGICIEPHPDAFSILESKRECIKYNCAIDTQEKVVDFYCNTGHTEQLSGLLDYYHPKHLSRKDLEIAEHGGDSSLIKVQARPLSDILRECSISHIDYLSVDVEGAELAVMKSIDFDEVSITCIDFENNYDTTDVEDYLIQKGYEVKARIKWDTIMIKS